MAKRRLLPPLAADQVPPQVRRDLIRRHLAGERLTGEDVDLIRLLDADGRWPLWLPGDDRRLDGRARR